MAGHVTTMPPDMPVLLLAARAPSSLSSQSRVGSNVDVSYLQWCGSSLVCSLVSVGDILE